MLSRVLENEVMDSAEEACDYDSMDHSQVNRCFVDDLLTLTKKTHSGESWIDFGTGTAQIPIEICARKLGVQITGIDLASHMLQLGQRNVIRAGYDSLIRLIHADAKGLGEPDESYDGVISNSIIHHIPVPESSFREMKRLVRSDGFLFVRDLLRPQSIEELTKLVELHASTANASQRGMFAASLHAALSLEELAMILDRIGIPQSALQQTSDRHWTLFWMNQ